VVQIEPEARLEVAPEHSRGFSLEDRVARQPARQHPHGGFGVDAERFEEHDRLGDQLDGAGDDELIGGLDGLAGAMRPDVDDGLAKCLEHRLGGFEVGGVAADHD
jgi:hypothetical protein